MNTKTLLILAGGAALVYFLMKKKAVSPTAARPAYVPLVPNSPLQTIAGAANTVAQVMGSPFASPWPGASPLIDTEASL